MKGTIKGSKRRFRFYKIRGSFKRCFFHANNLENAEFNDLNEGQTLEFEIGEGKNGKEQAINVTLVEDEE